MKEVLEVEKIYMEAKNKYDILYRELNIEKTQKTSKFILAVLVTTLVFNILNFIVYFKK